MFFKYSLKGKKKNYNYLEITTLKKKHIGTTG
jgi:hypothetical protein